MNYAVGRHLAAGIALASASTLAITAITPATPPNLYEAVLEVRLAAAVTNSNGATIPTSAEVDAAIANGDIRNIPLNGLYTLANVPYNQTKAINHLAASLLYTGSWFAVSGTNVFGTDPADPGHFESIISVLTPYPAIADITGYQLAMVAAALLPASDACDAEGCAPLIPVVPITGIASLDRLIYTVEIVLGLRGFPLLDNFFSADALEGLASLAGYTFPNDRYISVSPGVGENGSIPTQIYTDSMGNKFTFLGTTVDPVTGQNMMPWAGTTFVWDSLLPWKALLASLVSTPPTDGVYGTGFKIASFKDTIYAYQALLAGLVVDFNPFVPGSPFCPGSCFTFGITTPKIVKFISDLYPGNPMLEQWLNYEAANQANGPTDEQVQLGIDALQTGLFAFDDKTTKAINAALAAVHPVLPRIAADIGLLDAWNPNALLNDIADLTGISAAAEYINDRFGVDEALQQVTAALNDVADHLNATWKQVDANLKAFNAQVNAALRDIGKLLGLDAIQREINAGLTAIGTTLNEVGSFPKSQSTAPASIPDLTPMNVTAALVGSGSEPTKQVSASILDGSPANGHATAGALGGGTFDAPALPNGADQIAGQPQNGAHTSTGTEVRGGLAGALVSAGEEVGAGDTEITGGLTGGDEQAKQEGGKPSKDSDDQAGGAGDSGALSGEDDGKPGKGGADDDKAGGAGSGRSGQDDGKPGKGGADDDKAGGAGSGRSGQDDGKPGKGGADDGNKAGGAGDGGGRHSAE
jgi:hypothetical protein